MKKDKDLDIHKKRKEKNCDQKVIKTPNLCPLFYHSAVDKKESIRWSQVLTAAAGSSWFHLIVAKNISS